MICHPGKSVSALLRRINALFILIALSLISAGTLVKEAIASDPIIVGCPLPIGFPQGLGAKQGFELAVKRINQKGGVWVGDERRPLKLVVMDTRDLAAGTPVSESLLAVERLILQKKADFLLGGPIRSEAALAVMDLIAAHKKVSIITAGAITPGYTGRIKQNHDKYKYLFRLSANAVSFVGETLTFFGHMKEKFGFRKVAIMVQDVLHARQMAKFVKGGLAKMGGWEVEEPMIYPTGAMDYSTGLLKIRRQKPQVVFVWMDHPEVSILIKQAYDFKLPALLVGKLGGLSDPDFWKASAGKCMTTIGAEMKSGSLPSSALAGSQGFYDETVKMNGKGPVNEWMGTSFIGVYVLAEAIERAGTLNADAVIKELEKTDRPSLIGRIKFDPGSHQVIEKLDPDKGAISMWAQWQAGKRVPVFPPEIAEEVILPPWMK